MFCFLNRESRKHSGRSSVGQVDEDIKSRVFFCLPSYFKQTALPEKSARLFFVLILLLFFVVLPQFGNTCYCNSVLQALYFCRPFRENVLAYKAQQKKKENLLTCLADLFHSIATQKKKVGVIPPKKFISRLRKENGDTLVFMF